MKKSNIPFSMMTDNESDRISLEFIKFKQSLSSVKTLTAKVLKNVLTHMEDETKFLQISRANPSTGMNPSVNGLLQIGSFGSEWADVRINEYDYRIAFVDGVPVDIEPISEVFYEDMGNPMIQLEYANRVADLYRTVKLSGFPIHEHLHDLNHKVTNQMRRQGL